MITQLHIHHLRNIEQIKTALHPTSNIIFGENGSGKTSVLEAIYLLTTGHSFRTRDTNSLITFNHEELLLYAKLDDGQMISMQKHKKSGTVAKINDNKCKNTSSLARFVPSQVIYSDIFQILETGPSTRRSLIDWGMFHVKQEYHVLWKKYLIIVKHRNSLLKQHKPARDFLPWDQLLVQYAESLHGYRLAYFQLWAEQFKHILSKITELPCTISYYPGWDLFGDKSFATQLQESFKSDAYREFTQIGAHHADIHITIEESLAKKTLSRGQQKIILIALKLAQTALLIKPCLMLFDDIGAELDRTHLRRIGELLLATPGQKIITTVEPQVLDALRIIEGHVFQMTAGSMVQLAQ